MASVEEDRIGAAVINLWLLIANASKVERATNDAVLSVSDGSLRARIFASPVFEFLGQLVQKSLF